MGTLQIDYITGLKENPFKSKRAIATMVEPVDFDGFYDSRTSSSRALKPDLVKTCRSASSTAAWALMNRALGDDSELNSENGIILYAVW